ncbi:hypothetical protein QAD02_005267 [Eretmocerus hayati]|uniref:Uncharacterized protein n=1 Tax=Eretmocerus hayati TaxID=131215 RepID=A0ACC2NRV6_9HYME|nr:hypothetical protein QAD02_005267 [Eretmocerus hayati]
MKTTFVLAICASLAIIGWAAEPNNSKANQSQGKYTSRFDNVNIDQILSNKRLLDNYIKCLNDKVKCNADGAELKRLLPEALKTNCEKCTEKQQQGSKKVIAFLAKERPNDWEQLLKKYDPQNVYKTKYAEEAAKLGVV